VQTFDSDPAWVGPKAMKAFLAEPDRTARRARIQAARHRGSMPEDVADALDEVVGAGACRVVQGDVSTALVGEGRTVGLRAADAWVVADRVILATGFAQRRPGGALVDALVEEHGLPCAACGSPLVGPDLRWHERVVVTGALAELEIGPVARNLVGARRTGERLATAGA
jgi:hypothetical protein